MSEFWLNQNLTDNMTFNTFKIMCRNKLKLFYTDKWLNSVSQSNKGLFYKEYKTELKFENYLVEMDVSLRYFLVKFRTSNLGCLLKKEDLIKLPELIENVWFAIVMTSVMNTTISVFAQNLTKFVKRL